MRRRTTAALAATAALGATTAASVAAGRYAGTRTLLGLTGPGPPPGFRDEQVTVHGVAAGRITLTRTPGTVRPGRYAVVCAAGRAVVGPVLEAPPGTGTVTRRLEHLTGAEPVPGSTGQLTPQLYAGDPSQALGLDHGDIRIPGARGPLPAWYADGARHTWVVALHGLGTTREHALNLLPFLHRHRFPVLVPGHRGDPAGPRPEGDVSRLDADAWRDADAAVHHALRFGARRVLLYGWSVGATMALHVATRSTERGRIAGLVLDSPVLDWPVTLRTLAAWHGVPAPLLPLAVRAAQGRIGPEGPAQLDGVVRPNGLPLPILLAHGPEDTVAPWEPSRRFAARHPESVTLHSAHHAEHAAVWNANPDGYEETLRRFLTPLT